MNLNNIRAGLATAADTITGLTADSYRPEQITGPTFFTTGFSIEFTGAMKRGLDMVVARCVVLVPRTNAQVSTKTLDGYLDGSGGTSVKAAIESDSTLGGVCDQAFVMSADGGDGLDVGGIEYASAEWLVRIIGSGT